MQAKSESCSIACVRTQHARIKLSPLRFANRLIYLQLRTRLGKEKRPPETIPAAFVKSWLPTLDNLRTFFLTTTTEMQFLPTVARNALKSATYSKSRTFAPYALTAAAC